MRERLLDIYMYVEETRYTEMLARRACRGGRMQPWVVCSRTVRIRVIYTSSLEEAHSASRLKHYCQRIKWRNQSITEYLSASCMQRISFSSIRLSPFLLFYVQLPPPHHLSIVQLHTTNMHTSLSSYHHIVMFKSSIHIHPSLVRENSKQTQPKKIKYYIRNKKINSELRRMRWQQAFSCNAQRTKVNAKPVLLASWHEFHIVKRASCIVRLNVYWRNW